MVSPYYSDFLSNNLAYRDKKEKAVKILDLAFSFTSNIPTVRNVAEASSFCTYYSLLLQKYGVILEYNQYITEIGSRVHDLLSLASLKLFDPSKPKIEEKDVLDSIDKAREELEKIHKETENDEFSIDNKTLQLATKLMRRLTFEALRQLVNKKVISDYAFFPIVEQTFADFDYKLYGVPDLILEREDRDFAIIVEWKSHSIDEERDSPNEKDMAQAIAYSIFEAKRMGINSYDKIFEAISGLTVDEVESLNESVNENKIMKEALERLKILPVVVGRNGGFPPHPLLMTKSGYTAKRFKRMLRLFQGVIVGAEFLTLQLANITGLLWGYYTPDEIKEIFESVRGRSLVYQLAPDTLQWRMPGGESVFCKTRCPIILSKNPINPCKDYFVHKDLTNLDKEEWAERSEVLSKRDRGFLNHKVIDIILDEKELEKLKRGERFIYRVRFTKEGTKVERIKTQESVNTVRVYKGNNQLLTLKFDLFNKIHVNDNKVVLYREAREEEKKGKGGVLRNLITISLLGKSNVPATLSISTPIEVSEVRQKDGSLFLIGIASAFSLYKSLKRFEYYLKYYENKDHVFLAYESYSDLSSVENKGIYITYELLRKVEPKNNPTVLEKLKGILGDD